MRGCIPVVGALGVLLLIVGGCATIVQGTTQKIPVMSSPPGAAVYVNGQQMGVTPTNIELRRRDDTVISFQKDGYQTQSSVVTSCVSGWFAGNILLGGIIGGAVDLASGAAYRLVPENLSVTLSPLGPSERAAAPFAGKVTPELKLAQLELLKAQGQITPDEYAAQKKLLEEEKQRAAQPASTTG